MCSGMGNIFSNFCNNKLYDYFILFHHVFLIFHYGKNKLKLRQYPSRQRSTVRSVTTRRDKCTRTERKFKVDFLENKASNEKFLFYIFDLFFRVESPPFRLYYQLPTTLYIYLLKWIKVGINGGRKMRTVCIISFMKF